MAISEKSQGTRLILLSYLMALGMAIVSIPIQLLKILICAGFSI